MRDPRSEFAIVVARRAVENLERSHIWQASLQKPPYEDGHPTVQLVQAMRRPFMNWKEAREQLEDILGDDFALKSSQVMSFKGSKTIFPKPEQVARLTEPWAPTPPSERKKQRVSLGRDYSNVQGMA